MRILFGLAEMPQLVTSRRTSWFESGFLSVIERNRLVNPRRPLRQRVREFRSEKTAGGGLRLDAARNSPRTESAGGIGRASQMPTT